MSVLVSLRYELCFFKSVSNFYNRNTVPFVYHFGSNRSFFSRRGIVFKIYGPFPVILSYLICLWVLFFPVDLMCTRFVELLENLMQCS